MDESLKQKALQQLARTQGDVANTALNKEAKKISEILKNETLYDEVFSQLELLDIIAFRTHKQSVEIISDFLTRLETLSLTYQELPGYPAERRKEYQNNNTLIAKALLVLEHIRYHEPKDIIELFFKYSAHQNESVRTQARHGLEALSGYDLNIFYGDGQGWAGLGWEPQEKVLDTILSFDNSKKCLYFSGIISACEKMLSPTISGTKYDYNTVTMSTGSIPALDGIKDLRKKTLKILQDLYPLAQNIKQKKSIISSMHAATQTPSNSKYGDDVLIMIMDDTLAVIEFMKSVVSNEDLQIQQSIEHDVYFFFRRGVNKKVKEGALEIKEILDKDSEYQIFKVLIGFQGVFGEWSEEENIRANLDLEKEIREKKIAEFAKEITEETYNVWKERILSYASIQSNDMATFPYFGKFLELFAKSSPLLALRLLEESSEQIENFLIAILYGISQTDKNSKVDELISTWCNQEKYLFSLARFFEFSPQLNEKLFKQIFEKAKATSDINTLNQIITSVSAQYRETNTHLIKEFFIPALEKLTEHKNSGWIFGFWFRKQRADILNNMNTSEHKTILDNLFLLDKIDYHAEEILCEIAKQSPELVLRFFCKRLAKEIEKGIHNNYDAIPYEFHKISEPLSKIPDMAVDIVKEMYDGNYGLFIYRGAKLIKNIFPDFPIELQRKLVEVIGSNKRDDYLFVMAILKNYEGNPIIHEVCKELIKLVQGDNSLENEITIILQSTGVVHGEFGFVEAFKNKIIEITPWLKDRDEKIQQFAKNYISNLEKRIEYEQKRADEDIILRKHQYGE